MSATSSDFASLKQGTGRPRALSMNTQTTADRDEARFWRFSVAPMMDGKDS
jgi:hypothetical protein